MNNSIKEALHLLNKFLGERNRTIGLKLVGSYAIELLGINIGRMTEDIDPVRFEAIDEEIEKKILEIEDALDLPDWFDFSASGLPLPDGFEERLIQIKEYSHIDLWILGRQDLISMKLSAYHLRKERTKRDLGDLKSMRPTLPEMEKALKFTLAQGPDVKQFKERYDQEVKDSFQEVCDELEL